MISCTWDLLRKWRRWKRLFAVNLRGIWVLCMALSNQLLDWISFDFSRARGRAKKHRLRKWWVIWSRLERIRVLRRWGRSRRSGRGRITCLTFRMSSRLLTSPVMTRCRIIWINSTTIQEYCVLNPSPTSSRSRNCGPGIRGRRWKSRIAWKTSKTWESGNITAWSNSSCRNGARHRASGSGESSDGWCSTRWWSWWIARRTQCIRWQRSESCSVRQWSSPVAGSWRSWDMVALWKSECTMKSDIFASPRPTQSMAWVGSPGRSKW